MPRKKQPKPDDVLSAAEVRHFVSLVRGGNPDVRGSEELLRLFCQRAKGVKFSPFPEPLLDLLITAFERYLSGEEKDLARSLGLKKRGKRPDGDILKRNVLIAADVFRLKEKGVSLTPNRLQDGAFYIVAQQYSLSEQEVRDIYYKYRIDGMSIILDERWLEDDLPLNEDSA